MKSRMSFRKQKSENILTQTLPELQPTDPRGPAYEFVARVARERSINFSAIARSMNLSWTRDIVPAILDDMVATQELRDAIASIKHTLQDSILHVALFGKENAKVDPVAAREAIKLIDSGALLSDFDTDKPQDSAITEKFLTELGLKKE